MNKQGPGKIDWTDYTWNPICGCLHDCFYCYMLRMQKRFKDIMTPNYKPHLLSQPASKQKPCKIFVSSSGDMWGEWVPAEWIEEVLKVVKSTPQHTYQFLTKNPDRYIMFEPAPNAWYGTTVDGTGITEGNTEKLVENIQPCSATRFVSFEPLLWPVASRIDLFGIKWIIIGADSNRGAPKPPDSWADDLIEKARSQSPACAVWVKDNYQYHTRIKEFPNG